MRITSIRSLPDLDTDDALQDADDEVKKHLKRDHVVSSRLLNVSSSLSEIA